MPCLNPRTLIIDRDPIVSDTIARALTSEHTPCLQASTEAEALGLLRGAHAQHHCRVGVLIIDQDCAGPDGGLDLMQRLQDQYPTLVPIVTSNFRKVDSAVRAMRCGAADYLLKPLIQEELAVAVEHATQQHLLLLNDNLPPVDTQPPLKPATADRQATTTRQTDDDAYSETAQPPADTAAAQTLPTEAVSLSHAMKNAERSIILAALKSNQWSRQQTARQLGINRTTLYKKMRHHGLDKPV